MIRSSILRAQISCHYSECFINSKLGLFHFLSCWMKVPDNLTHSLKHSVIHPETKLKEQNVWVRQMVRNASGWWSFPSVPSLDDCGRLCQCSRMGRRWSAPVKTGEVHWRKQLHGSSCSCMGARRRAAALGCPLWPALQSQPCSLRALSSVLSTLHLQGRGLVCSSWFNPEEETRLGLLQFWFPNLIRYCDACSVSHTCTT